MKKAVLSLSGGMDSTCLLVHLLANGYDEVKAISFDYGQKHKRELELAGKTVKNLQARGYNVTHHIVDLTSVGKLLDSALTSSTAVPEGHYEQDNMKATVVPNRNVIFGSIVYGIALSMSTQLDSQVDIALGVHSGDHAIYPDCRPESVEAVEKAFEISNWGSENVEYIRPYIDSDKEGILRDCLNNSASLGLDFDEVLVNTLTSYNPDAHGRSSGKSGSDIERIEAFIKIGRKDPIEYTDSWDEVVAHAKEVLGIE
jgi:7-cyano-7-deazaguanine synthase